MKILLSHSWADKALASIVKKNIELDGHEVWFDIHELLEGDLIQKTIDDYLEKCDVMVLLWSKNALTSVGVDCEIKTATRLKKRIIPFFTDDTKLDQKEELTGVLGVPAVELEIASHLLRCALLMLMIPDEYKTTPWFSQAYGNVKDLGGYLKYIETYRLPKNKNEDGYKDYLVQLLQQLSIENENIRKHLLPKAEADINYIQQIMAQLEKGNNSREKLEEWLSWCQKNKNAKTEMIQSLQTFIQKDLDRLNAGGSPVRALNLDILDQAEKRLRQAILQGKEEAEKNITEKVKKNTFGLLGDKLNQSIASGLLNYVVSAPDILKKLTAEARLSEFVAVKESLVTVANHLESQNHEAEIAKENLEGFFDDAYLINNTAKLLVEAELIHKDALSLDFVNSNITDKYFGFMLPNEVKQSIDAVLEEVRSIIGLKKNEINWGIIAAVVVGGIIAAKGISMLSDGFDGNANSESFSSGSGGTFEDKVSEFTGKYGGGLSDINPGVRYD